jgi:hypothetical protein
MNFDVFGPFEIPRVHPELTIIDDSKKYAVKKVSQGADNENGDPRENPAFQMLRGAMFS